MNFFLGALSVTLVLIPLGAWFGYVMWDRGWHEGWDHGFGGPRNREKLSRGERLT